MSKSYEKTVSIETFNELLSGLSYYNTLELSRPYPATLALKWHNCTYYTSLTGEKKNSANVGNIMAQLDKFAKREEYELIDKESYGYEKIKLDRFKTKIHWSLKDPGNFSYVNENYRLKWLKCYSYDINSAYSFAMLKPMPDTSKPCRKCDIINEGEIGFYSTGGATTEIGAWAEYIFPLKESPFKAYVEYYYEKKREAKTKEERNIWKNFLNIPSGMTQKLNIFVRLAILHYAAVYIESFIDEYTVYCNTDSIVSLVPRDDLPMGNEIGQFKAEHINDDFKYKQAGIYQWGEECHYKGIPGIALKDIENIKNWKDNLPYKYDTELRRIVENGKI